MAIINLFKPQWYLPVICANRMVKGFGRCCSSKPIDLDADILDEFTEQLMKTKSEKWNCLLSRRKPNKEQFKHNFSMKDYRNYINMNELDSLLEDAIETQNKPYIDHIVIKCVEFKKLPKLPILLQLLSYSAQNGDKHTILKIVEVCTEVQPFTANKYSHFKHYVAEAVWIGGNINEAINLFEEVYRSHMHLRRKIRSMLKLLIFESITNRSEATLVALISFSKRLVSEFKDFYPLASVWQACFLSEWYTDQCIAIDLLTEYDGLYKMIYSQLPYVVAIALNSHKIEIVYRLLEVLLKREEKNQCVKIVEALFNFRVRQGDLRGCAEIIKWSLQQGIESPAIQNETFVNLLILSVSKKPGDIDSHDKCSHHASISKYQFKF